MSTTMNIDSPPGVYHVYWGCYQSYMRKSPMEDVIQDYVGHLTVVDGT